LKNAVTDHLPEGALMAKAGLSPKPFARGTHARTLLVLPTHIVDLGFGLLFVMMIVLPASR
jgi:hypothetical protein